jgi:hypothetical protein
MINSSILILISLLLPSVGFGTVETDVLSGKISIQPSISKASDCAECETLRNKDTNCSEVNNFLINETLSKTIYNSLIKKKLLDVCLSISAIINSSPENIDSKLNTMLDHKFHVSQSGINSCLIKNNINLKAVNIKNKGIQEVITSYLHILHKNILDTQVDELRKIAATDQLLGKKPLEGFSCNSFEDKCNEIRKCDNSDSVDKITDFTFEVFGELNKLENQKRQLPNLRFNNLITEEQSVAAINDINNKSALLMSTIPWMKGDDLSGQLSKIKQNIKREIRLEETKSNFKLTLQKQLKKTSDQLKKNFYTQSAALECIENNKGCTQKTLENLNGFMTKDYSKDIKDLNPSYPYNSSNRKSYVELLEVNLLLKSGTCVSQLLNDKKSVDDSAVLVGTTAVGLAVGGFGGVFTLGEAALKAYQASSMLKGVASALLLAGETTSVFKNISDAADECKKSMNNLVDDSKPESRSCTEGGASMYKVSHLKSCFVNISTTTLPYLLSFRYAGKAKNVLDARATLSNTIKENAAVANKLNSPYVLESEKNAISHSLLKLNFNSTELDGVIKDANDLIKSDQAKNKFINYVNFSLSLKPEEQKLALKELRDVLLSAPKTKGSYATLFQEKEGKFYLMEKYLQKFLKYKYIAEGKSESTALREAESAAREGRGALQKKYYACQSQTENPELLTAAKRYLALTSALSIGGTSYGYYKNNKDKLVDRKMEFVTKLGYDLSMSYLMAKIGANIMNTPGSGVLQKYALANATSAGINVLDAITYAKFYGITEEEARIKVEEIMHSKEKTAELQKLDKFIDKEGLIEKFKDEIVSNYRKALKLKSKDEILGAPPYKTLGDKFSTLTESDLEKPEVKDKLVKAVYLQMNTGGLSEYSSGNKGVDRWVFDRTWNATLGVPKGIAVGIATFQVLCLGSGSPVTSLGVATGMQFANQFLSGDLYYNTRKEAIGQ